MKVAMQRSWEAEESKKYRSTNFYIFDSIRRYYLKIDSRTIN